MFYAGFMILRLSLPNMFYLIGFAGRLKWNSFNHKLRLDCLPVSSCI
jgi:hypothetical protein